MSKADYEIILSIMQEDMSSFIILSYLANEICNTYENPDWKEAASAEFTTFGPRCSANINVIIAAKRIFTSVVI